MPSKPYLRIQPPGRFIPINFSELWEYRELLYFLTWRDVKIRYKQTALGVAWVVIQPLAMMVIFTLFFGNLAQMPSDGIPYPLFSFAALLPWQLFSRTISDTTKSLVTDQRLITRVYFPRLLVPTASSLAALVDFVISMIVLFLLMFFYGYVPGISVVWLPLFAMLMVITALGIGFWLSALNLEYRDVMYTIPFLNQFLMFLAPVVYPISIVPEKWRLLYGLNPMVGVIEGFRWALLGSGEGPSLMILVSCSIAVLLFVSGIIWFRKKEMTFVDVLGSGGL